MAGLIRGEAKERIEFGAHVLCRQFEVTKADPSIANGTARPPPSWTHEARKGHYDVGDYVDVSPIEGIGQRDIHALAAGPIMEPLKLNLPAGKLSESEYQQRLDLQFKEAGLDRP